MNGFFVSLAALARSLAPMVGVLVVGLACGSPQASSPARIAPPEPGSTPSLPISTPLVQASDSVALIVRLL